MWDLKDLDISLRNARLINPWLGSWLIEAGKNPSGVKMHVVADELDCQMIELQDKDGVARGGIIFQLGRATVHLLAATDPKNEPFSKRRGRQSIKASRFSIGYTYGYEISDDTVKNTPSWNPEKEDAPLSFRQAIDIA